MINPQDEFRDIIRELAREEAGNLLQTEDVYRNIMGSVVAVKDNNKYDVDIVTTILHNVINQSGNRLKPGDGVIVAEKYGSNYSNCYISSKTGKNEKTIEDTEETLNQQLNNLKFSVDSDNKKLVVELPDGNIRYITFD